jgi:hypothetical protein
VKAYHIGVVRRIYFLGIEIIPVDVSKEIMILYLLEISFGA